jgi:TRAP-type C4-dicarboxylate transport system permease small subunit
MLIGMKPERVFEDTLGAFLMAALLLITLLNVFVRYFTDQSFAWTEEISCFLMLVLAMAGSVAAVVRDSHIRVDYFLASGSDARQRRLALLSAAEPVILARLADRVNPCSLLFLTAACRPEAALHQRSPPL